MASDVMSVSLWLPRSRMGGVVLDAHEAAGGAGVLADEAPKVVVLFGAEEATA